MTSGRPQLATWAQRLTALAIDSFSMFVLMVLLMATVGGWDTGNGAIALAMVPVGIGYHAAGVRNARLSFGRTIVGVAVVSVNGAVGVTPGRAALRACVRVGAAALAAFIAIGTRQAWIAVLPLLIDLVLMSHTAWRRSVADLVAGTIVVNAPAHQPHPVPAAPMYSATDQAFGPRP